MSEVRLYNALLPIVVFVISEPCEVIIPLLFSKHECISQL